MDEKCKRTCAQSEACGLPFLVVVTLGLYWSLLESGLALIAACLPTLSSLVLKERAGLNTMLRSIRSVFSLRSTGRSVRSDESDPIYLQRTFKVSVEQNKPAEAETTAKNNMSYDIDRV